MSSYDQKKPVTIKSIAQELGISFSTVSKALNGNPLIKEDTRKLVEEKAKEMGYTPNSLAKGLRGNSTKTIAVIFNDIENPVLTHIFRNLAVEMAKYGYTTMIFDSQFSEKVERNNILTVLSRQPDFIILEPTTTNPANLQLLKDFSHKLILQGARYESFNCHHVHVDYALGGYLAASELLSKGHEHCLVITEPLTFPTSEQFLLGIRKAYDEYGLSLSEDYIYTTHASITNGYQTIRLLWDNEKKQFTLPFTGVLTFCDTLAHGVYKAVTQYNMEIPKDISVIGFDDNPLTEFSMPPLTTVHLPKEKMAEGCISILHSVLLDHHSEKHVFSLDPYLKKRKSVRNLLE